VLIDENALHMPVCRAFPFWHLCDPFAVADLCSIASRAVGSGFLFFSARPSMPRHGARRRLDRGQTRASPTRGAPVGTEQISTAKIGRERAEPSGRHHGGAATDEKVSRSRGGQPATGTGLLVGWGATRAASLSHQTRARTIYLSI